MLALTLWLTILIGTALFGLIAGVPLWMVLRHPDRNPAQTRRLPAYLHAQTAPITLPAQATMTIGRDRELVGTAAR